ncbi:MAG TPA: hypothetical protein DF613_01680 [Lachnospiraceae bacterium]|nr:hypothetical protein [Lachnospiraceae bacterium]
MRYTDKENMLRVFRHEIPEGLPHLLMDGTHFLAPQNGIHERPTGGKGGTDWFGVKWSYIEGDLAPVPDSTVPPVCDDICDWETQIHFPDMEAWDWEEAARIDHVAELDREHKMIYTSSLSGFFERLHMLLGFEEALCALVTDPEAVAAYLDRMVEFKKAQLTKIKQYYNPDVLNFHDDYGTQRGLFFSPETWRTLFKPRLKQIVDHCHGLGMIFELHSCGKIEEIVPDIAEIGTDCLQCMDINDVAALKKKTGKSMAYGVSPDFQKYAAGLATGEMTEEDIRREVYAEYMELSEGGNYYPFINPPFTKMDTAIWEAHLEADAELRRRQEEAK